ncbi:MAG TPA: hypothetical protein VG096_19215 [Bryobacteraceae bacterium]|nr:hypothetical protein [Bryobacteraceae bacterium]
MPARSITENLVLGAIAIATLPLWAQWQDVKTTRVPRGRDGKPDLNGPAPKMADGKTPDLSGIWNPIRVPCTPSGIGAIFGCSDVPLGVPIGLFDVTDTGSKDGQPGDTPKLPYQAGVEASVQQHLAEDRRGDPTTRCLPISPVRQWADFFPQKIIQTADSVTVLSEYMVQFRQIFLDGRPLPKDPFPSFKGYSVGHWDGDALVVETIGYKDGLWLDLKGDPLTSGGRTIERIRRPTYGSLEVDLTVDDPKVYTRPWHAKRYLHTMLDTELIEDICNDNEKSFVHIFGK